MKYYSKPEWRVCELYKNETDVKAVELAQNSMRDSMSGNQAARYIDKTGREHIEVPAIILGQQVLYGAGGYEYGAELMTEKALVNSVSSWNNVTVTINHTDGSATSIENLEEEKVGFIYNAEIIGYDEDPTHIRIKCMLRLDVEVLKMHDDGEFIIQTFDSGEIMEMSTGYFVTDWLWQEGSFRGVDYVAQQQSITPNHLALLLHAVGAMSILDGGGANRKNKGELMFKDGEKKEIATIFNELIDERLADVPTKNALTELIGGVTDRLDKMAEQAKPVEVVVEPVVVEEVEEVVEEPAKNEAREALVKKVAKNSGLSVEVLNETSDEVLENMAKAENTGIEIPHPEIKDNEGMLIPSTMFKNKETE